jgi:hypothetical protein
MLSTGMDVGAGELLPVLVLLPVPPLPPTLGLALAEVRLDPPVVVDCVEAQPVTARAVRTVTASTRMLAPPCALPRAIGLATGQRR